MKIIICNNKQLKTKQGIHLNNPDSWYLNDAFQTAEKDNFEVIYLHYDSKGARYAIPSDVLEILFNCQLEVITIDPRISKDSPMIRKVG